MRKLIEVKGCHCSFWFKTIRNVCSGWKLRTASIDGDCQQHGIQEAETQLVHVDAVGEPQESIACHDGNRGLEGVLQSGSSDM